MARTNLINLLRSPENRFALLFGLMLFFLPFGIDIISSILMLSVLIHSFVFLKKEDWSNGFRNPLFIVSGLFFVYYATTILWAQNRDEGWAQLETKMSFFIVLAVVASNKRFVGPSFRMQISTAFIWGNVAVMIAALAWATMRSIDVGQTFYLSAAGREISFFTYTELSSPFMHVGYLSTMVGVAMLFGIEKMVSNKGLMRLGYILVLTLLFVFLFLLQGRINVLGLFATLGLWGVFYLVRKRKFKFLLVPLVGLLLVIVAVPILPDSIKARYLELPNFDYDISGEPSDFNSATYRLAEWTGAIKLIAENPVFGTGVGDNRLGLIEKYEEIGFHVGVEERYNAHNQYLETWIASGVIGLFLLLSIFLCYGYLAFKRRDYTTMFALFFFAFCMLTESMFERAWAVVFFTIYFPLILLAPAHDAVNKKL